MEALRTKYYDIVEGFLNEKYLLIKGYNYDEVDSQREVVDGRESWVKPLVCNIYQ